VSNVREFVEIRLQIESLASEMAVFIDRKSMPQSQTRLDEAGNLLAKLTAMADNDVQNVAVARLTRLLGNLETKVAKLKPPKKERKKS
jgi:hypothetical protein